MRRSYQNFPTKLKESHGKDFLISVAILLENNIAWHFPSQGDLCKFLPTYCDDLQEYSIEDLMKEVSHRICLAFEAQSFTYSWE